MCWRSSEKSATVEEVALENGESRQVIICNIKTMAMRITEEDFNQVFKIPEDVVAPSTDGELVDFMDLIHYSSEIDLARLNKKFVRREWSFLYDTMLKVFAGRKTGWDQISYIAQYLVYSLAHGRPINVGKLILKELTRRLANLLPKEVMKSFSLDLFNMFLILKMIN